MGVILMLFGVIGALLSLIGLLTGRLWFIRSRKQAGLAALLSVALFILGGNLLDTPVGHSGIGIALMVTACILAVVAIVRPGGLNRGFWRLFAGVAAIGLLGIGIYADGRTSEIEAATSVDWTQRAFELNQDLEATSARAFMDRRDPFVRERWSEWARDWEARQRQASRMCSAAARASRLNPSQEAACDAIVALEDVFDAYRDLIMDTDPTPRQIELRKERLELARRIVNQALDRAAP